MPTYDYECKKCGHQFTLAMTMGEHEKKKIQCPKCHSEEVQHGVEPVYVTTARKS